MGSSNAARFRRWAIRDTRNTDNALTRCTRLAFTQLACQHHWLSGSRSGPRNKGLGMLSGAKKDSQLISETWQKVEERIDGVVVREVLHVPRDHGIITEMYRPPWDPTGLPVVHAYQSRLYPGAIGAWSCH